MRSRSQNAFYLRPLRREIYSVKLMLARNLFQEDIENGIFEVRYASPAVFGKALSLSEKHTRKLGNEIAGRAACSFCAGFQRRYFLNV